MFRLGITSIRLGKIVSICFFHTFERTAHQKGARRPWRSHIHISWPVSAIFDTFFRQKVSVNPCWFAPPPSLFVAQCGEVNRLFSCNPFICWLGLTLAVIFMWVWCEYVGAMSQESHYEWWFCCSVLFSSFMNTSWMSLKCLFMPYCSQQD